MAEPAADGRGHLPAMALRRPQQPGQRKTAALFLLAAVLFSLFSAVGIYQAYHYTESVEFCGLTCHKVMKPEYTAYQASPHARVRCVNCHIGPGAGWYAKSKLSGLYQVYAVLADVYPRPIPTPIENLRPGPGDLRDLPLAARLLRVEAASLFSLPLRQGQLALAHQHAGQDRRRQSSDQPDRRASTGT